jgi:hypothetical protein
LHSKADGRQEGAPAGEARTRLGRGRSGEVWLVEADGRAYAEKVFYGDTLANFIHYVTSGAPNPYIWNEDAVRAAYERRRILKALLPYWFGAELDIADALDVTWNDEARVFTLATEYVPGPFVPLRHPYRHGDTGMARLAWHLMPRLQERLEEAGFDGLVWQAGRGNPVALNNFLTEDVGSDRYVFIDAESGVPAIFAVSFRAQFGYYIPKAIARGRLLFDDVDTDRLGAYLDEHETALRERLGGDGFSHLRERVDRLARHQSVWTQASRQERAIEYQRVKGRLSDDAAAYYRQHPLRWRLRETGRAFAKIAYGIAVKIPRKIARAIGGFDLRAAMRRSWAFVSSEEYRARLGEGYVRDRIEHWRKRRQLSEADAERLLADLAQVRERSAYITDFGSHLGMKASFLVLEIIVLGGLSLLGVPLLLLALIFAIDGPIYRTIYTLYRFGSSLARRQRPPWIALAVGLIPFAGSLAYPAQMLWSAEQERDDVAQFIIYDAITRLGAKIPLLGGDDTETEHAFNRFASRLLGSGAAKA